MYPSTRSDRPPQNPMTSPAAEKPLSVAVAGAVAGACFFFLIRAALSLKSLLFLLARLWRWVEDHTQAFQTFTICRHSDHSPENPLYRKAVVYVASIPAAEDSDHTSLFCRPNEFSVRLISGQVVVDSFLGARLTWTFYSGDGNGLVLRVRRQDRRRVLRPYLRHVESVAEEIGFRRKEIWLYTNDAAGAGAGKRWRAAPMTHPATFDTLAIDPEVKDRVRGDLEQFVKGRAGYARMGRAWKRSYLLHGPPGTGKSSFVAAMARFLCYDVYDLDLSRISGGCDFRSLLFDTTPRSVILVEDLDRYLAGGGESRISGVLCFMDGVFSCCGEERVMVFTGRGEEAVLRRGGVDVQVHFPLCNFATFKTMANSYLGVRGHKLYAQVEEVFQSGGKMSHAELGEMMMANRGSPSRALKNVISALQRSAPAPAPAPEKVDWGAHREGGKEGGRDFGKLCSFIRINSWSKKGKRLHFSPVGNGSAAGGKGGCL